MADPTELFGKTEKVMSRTAKHWHGNKWYFLGDVILILVVASASFWGMFGAIFFGLNEYRAWENPISTSTPITLILPSSTLPHLVSSTPDTTPSLQMTFTSSGQPTSMKETFPSPPSNLDCGTSSLPALVRGTDSSANITEYGNYGDCVTLFVGSGTYEGAGNQVHDPQ